MSYLSKALANCREALTKPSDEPSTWQSACRTMGNILQGMGWFEEAVIWHSRATEQEIDLAEAYLDLGRLYTGTQEWQQAIDLYNEALNLKPDYAEACSCLAQIYSCIGQKKEELEYWHRTLTLKPSLTNARVYYQLGKMAQEQRAIDKAMEYYHLAIEKDASFWYAYRNLGEIYLNQKDWEKASNCYLQIIERDSTQIWAQYKLGTIWLKQKRFDEAIDAFRDTLKIDPNFPGSYKNIIQSFLQQQKWDEAIATCRAVIALVQEYPWVYSQLGNILAKKGETEEAIACFQKASELRGWHLCGEKGYRFSQDNFTNKIPIWESCLETLASRPGIKALEIGSFQGMSACWLIDRILTDSSATLTCIDTKFSEQFELNLAKTGASDKVNKLAGPLYKQLLSLESNDYDLINIQNRGKTPERVKQNIAVCWQLLKIGGIIIFKDYEGNDDRSLEESPQAGIKAFCDTVKEQFEILHQSHQLLVRKIAS